MSAADAVDKLVDDLDRVQLGDEYEPRASMPWASAREHWDLFVTLVALIDRAVHDPFGDSSAALLLSSSALHGNDVFELAFALSHVGEALTRARAQFAAAEAQGERHE